jgi:hypothetical protein
MSFLPLLPPPHASAWHPLPCKIEVIINTVQATLIYEHQVIGVFMKMSFLKMVVRPKHEAVNLNKIVNNYSNSVALDGNP